MESKNTAVLLIFFLTFIFSGVAGFAKNERTIQKQAASQEKSVTANDELWKRQAMRRQSTVAVGDLAPDFKLPTSDGRSVVHLAEFRRKRPVVLIFGSYTNPLIRKEADYLRKLHADFQGSAQFLFIYIREAHPDDGLRSEENIAVGIRTKDATTIKERCDQADETRKVLRLKMSCLVDSMDDPIAKTYAAWPARLCIVDKDGKIAELSKIGPQGFPPSLKAARIWLSSAN